jgi:hypothetical protein
MREALLICPTHDNSGRNLAEVRDQVAETICKEFGGCRIRNAEGTWRNDNGRVFREPVWEIVAAYDELDGGNDAIMRNLAVEVAMKGKQEAIYVRFASGAVEIIDTYSMVKAAA